VIAMLLLTPILVRDYQWTVEEAISTSQVRWVRMHACERRTSESRMRENRVSGLMRGSCA